VTIVAGAGASAAPSVTNTATVSSTTADPISSNNQASAPTTVTPEADVRLTKTDSPDPVAAGGNLTYTLTVHNQGPSPASGVSLSDPLPSSVTLVSATPTQGSCSGTTTVSCDLGTVPAGTANDATVTIVVRPGAISSVTNTASVSSSTADPSPGNNLSSAPTTVTPSADLSLTKGDSPDPVLLGGDVTYTLTVHNAGPSSAAGVSVSDPLPDGLTFVSADSTQGTCSGTATVSCAIGTVAAGAANDVTVTIVATAGPDAVPSVTNTATASSSTADPTSANNEASEQTSVDPAADLSLTKTDSPDPATVGSNLTYTLTVHNAGPSAAADVSVSDTLPDGVTFVSSDSSQGICSGTATVSCDIGTVAAGAANDATVTIVVTPGSSAVPNIENTATVSASTSDPSSADNEASADTAVAEPPATYVRPKGATPFRASLVPAYAPCSGANTVHGAPLAFGSCSPPSRISQSLTIGTPDANGAGANSTGSITMSVVPGIPATPNQDEADVQLQVSVSDVRNTSGLTDYTGELDARAGIRLTDKLNGPGETEAATVSDFDLSFPVTCAATPAPTSGATCSVSTTADAVHPGMVVETKRSIWELAQIVIDDGGPDGVASTPGNERFEVQGVFVP
jgi:uncharacterized repeat protein (TIGR01451 family)